MSTGADHAASGSILTVAAVIADPAGRVLLVRKRGSTTFIQPGGKREPGEDALVALARELDEELGVRLVAGSARRLGEFEDAAVNEPGRRVRAEAFAVAIDGTPQARAEIAELAWIEPGAPFPVPVAPLSAGHILPAYAQRPDTPPVPARDPVPVRHPMSTPPPLPAAAGFVTVLARISLVLAALGLVWAVGQMLLALALPDAAVARLAVEPQAPPGLVWVLEHRHLLSLAMLLSAAAFLAVAWGLLKRREWARLGFIMLLVVGAVANFAALALIDPFFDGLLGMFPAQMLDTPDGQQLAAQMRFNRNATLATSLIGAGVFAVLHGWLVWKLSTAAVREQFRR